MNREIKFRAWDKKEKMMCYVSLIDFENSTCVLIYPTKTYKEEDKSFSEVKLMQYTGLKDKNGKEIYEGDILKSVTLDGKVHHEPVKFHEGCFCKLTTLPPNNRKRWSSLRIHLYDDMDILIAYEVVGNVFENPELLEELK